MTCPGLHCPGCSSCSGGNWLVKLAVLAVLLVEVAEWLIARVWWILGGTAVAVLVPVYVVWRVTRWQEHREAVHAREHPFVLEREVPAAVAAGKCRELDGGTHIHHHLHLHGVAEDERAAIIRQAIPADATTEGQ